ncbi:Sau3AI family type II restriction endonuclease [Turicibacter sanguinis]|uniref:Sau3AI family type II restriction endonuclease n=1 Tax=Turicibacter sanguinis TaxID=154288 RepID=UPI00189A97EA|nr:Sau3AI family type II restriction endonuclease [Turicibacter sanguinis]
MGYIYSQDWTEQQIFEAAKELEGRKLGELDKTGWLKKKKDKGAIGNMIQSDFFGIPANSIKGPDFQYHHIELKVTPVKRIRGNGFSAKERLVLGMINYLEDYEIPFEESIVYKKAGHMLLVFYLYEENTPVEEFKIIKTTRFELPESDLEQVKLDYQSIIDKITIGQAHEISEKQQKIMGACTKGQGKGKDYTSQPNNPSIDAKSRAYSYKVGYMSSYFRNLMTPDEVEHILLQEGFQKSNQTFLESVESVLKNYIGKTDEEIQIELSTRVKGKSSLFNLMGSMLTTNGKNINHTDEFLKEGLAIKTVCDCLDKSKNQDMSFPNIDFTEILNDPFEESTWSGWLTQTKYILAVWKEYEAKKYRFIGYKIWEPDEELIDTASKLYNKVKDMLIQNQIIVEKDETKGKHGEWRDNLPGKKENYPPFQIRPKGSGESVFVTLPNGLVIKKKCLFLNKEYIRKIVNLD